MPEPTQHPEKGRERLLERMVRSPLNYWGGFLLDGGVSLAFLAAGLRESPLPWLARGAFLGAGCIAYTFIEYAVHRWIYHGRRESVSRLHTEHHLHPRRLIGAPVFFQAGICLAVWMLTAFAVGRSSAALFAGSALWGAVVHGALHHLMHSGGIRDDGLLGDLKRHHFLHHSGASRNFGVTTTFWDHLLGTRG